MTACDVVVIGLGAMGSAAAASLARRGCKVVGIERFEPGHDRGRSHGATRIIRQGYFEHPSYVPLVRAASATLCGASSRRLPASRCLSVTGIVEIGAPDSELIAGTLSDTSRRHRLPHDVLDADALRGRFPLFQVPDHYVAVFQPDGGSPARRAHDPRPVRRAPAGQRGLQQGEAVRGMEGAARMRVHGFARGA